MSESYPPPWPECLKRSHGTEAPLAWADGPAPQGGRASGSNSEVGLANGWVLAQVRSLAAHRDPSVLQHVAAVGDLEGEHDVLLDQQHGRAVLIDRLYDFHHPIHHLWGEAQRWLVDHQQFRPGHQSATDGDHLLLAARQR